ncbi:MAG: aconitase X swivel domain-containing protein [Candidatus Helarchaeota archaeon]
MPKILKGRGLSGGIAEGEAIVTNQPFNISASFAMPLIQFSKKCRVSDRTHELFKKDVTGKILIFPIPIGTTTMGFVLLETIIRGIGPKAIVCAQGEPLLSSGALCAEIFFGKPFPIVDQIDLQELLQIKEGTNVKVNGNEGTVEIQD